MTRHCHHFLSHFGHCRDVTSKCRPGTDTWGCYSAHLLVARTSDVCCHDLSLCIQNRGFQLRYATRWPIFHRREWRTAFSCAADRSGCHGTLTFIGESCPSAPSRSVLKKHLWGRAAFQGKPGFRQNLFVGCPLKAHGMLSQESC